jgi:hypothetical protein
MVADRVHHFPACLFVGSSLAIVVWRWVAESN